MASKVLTNTYLNIDSNDLSAYIQSMTVNYETETADDSTMGDTTRSQIPTVKNWSIDVTFRSDLANGLLDDLVFPLVGTGGLALEMRPDAGAVSSDNPKYTANCAVTGYSPFGGSWGDLSTSPISIVPSKGSGSATLVRAES